MSKLVVFQDGQECYVETRVNDPRLSPWRVDNFKPKEDEILLLLRAYGLIREGKVGMAPSCVIDAAGLFTAMQDWAARGITIYHEPRLLNPRRLLNLEQRRYPQIVP